MRRRARAGSATEVSPGPRAAPDAERARDARRSQEVGLPPGCFLGIETSGPPGSVAVTVDGVVAAMRSLGDQASHADRLIPAIRGVLEDAGRSREDLEGVAVGAGPGSFTGVRVGAATAKGLARALNVPLCATSSLRAAAFAQESMAGVSALVPEVAGPLGPSASGSLTATLPEDRRQVRYILADARGGRVYGACYDVGAEGPIEVTAPHGGTIVDVINRRPPMGTVFAGSGAEAHKRLLEAAGYAVAPPPAGVPVAAAVLRCCRWTPVDVADWEPDYVREWRPG